MPNHAPLPVLEQVNPAMPENDDCATLKQKYGIETDNHQNNVGSKKKQKIKDGKMKFDADKVKGRTTKDGAPIPGSSFYQSHHVHQDQALEGLVQRAVAWAVMLYDNLGNSEHGRITSLQNERAKNKGQAPPTGPARNYGELRDCSRSDLEQGLKAEKKRTGMSEPEAKKLAECIEEEAHQKNKEEYKKANDGEELLDSTPVAGAGCFAGDTLLWCVEGLRRADQVARGDRALTPFGPLPVVRLDRCLSRLDTLQFAGWSVTIAPFHRVVLANGQLKRVSALRLGEALSTARGRETLIALRRGAQLVPLCSVGLPVASTLFAGLGGLRVELPWLGPPQIAEVPLSAWSARRAAVQPSTVGNER